MSVIPREFDFAGRHRRVDLEANMREVSNRLENHSFRCIHCLRFETGRAVKPCAVGVQIRGQKELIERAFLR